MHTADGLLIDILLPERQPQGAQFDVATVENVKRVLRRVPRGSYVIQDNLYNFERLFEWATERGFYLLGTMRQNRIRPVTVYANIVNLPNKHQWKTMVILYLLRCSIKGQFITLAGMTPRKLSLDRTSPLGPQVRFRVGLRAAGSALMCQLPLWPKSIMPTSPELTQVKSAVPSHSQMICEGQSFRPVGQVLS